MKVGWSADDGFTIDNYDKIVYYIVTISYSCGRAFGDVIEGTGGARKMRIQLSGRGKSGGARVIYVDVLEQEHLYLLFAYPKNVQENLTPSQKQMIHNAVDAIRKEGRNV